MKSYVVPKELKKDRKHINVSAKANHFYKSSNNRKARRAARRALKQGKDVQTHIAGYLS